MYKSDIKLFGDAVLNGIINRFEKEVSRNQENDLCSEAHKEVLCDLIRQSCVDEKRRSKIRLIAALVAAALFLVGCAAYVYRNEIGSFVETVFEEYVNVGFSDVKGDVSFNGKENNDNYATEIEEVYELSYVPAGYELIDLFINDTYVAYTYGNDNGSVILFDQCPLGVSYSIGIDNDLDDVTVIEHNGIEYYARSTGIMVHYVWHDEDYAMVLDVPSEISQDEVFKIIDKIKKNSTQ